MQSTASLRRFWCWLWAGYPSIAAKRRALEQDVHRFGGRVTWRDTCVIADNLEVLKFEPDDRCVLLTSQSLSNEQREAIRGSWQQFAPGIPVVILDSGLSITVLRSVEAASHGRASSVTGGSG